MRYFFLLLACLCAFSISIAQTVIGTTYQDFFDYGCSPRRIAYDAVGGLHATWMNLPSVGGTRVIEYNHRAPYSEWLAVNGITLFNGASAGYPCIGLKNHRYAIITAHRPGTSLGYTTTVAVDSAYPAGRFSEHPIANSTNPPADSIIWPNMVIARNNRPIIFSREYPRSDADYCKLFYSVGDTSQSIFTTFAPAESTSFGICALAASRISNRVVMAWAQSVYNGYQPESTYDGINDLYLLESTNNGVSWNFDTPRNITRSRLYQNENDPGDTLWCSEDANMIFDNQDHLHIVFITRGLWLGPPDTMTTGGNIIRGFTTSHCFLWHWTETRPDSFDIVADGWWWSSLRYITMAYQSTISRPSLSIGTNGNLYCVFTRYAQNDTSANGWPCGDIWASVSVDNGDNWSMATNLTNTINHGEPSGSANSEMFPSVQEVVNDDTLYVMYLLDKSGGCASAEYTLANDLTLNSVVVRSVCTEQIRNDYIINPAAFPHLRHFSNTAVRETEKYIPRSCSIVNNYPNPFNGTTDIEYTIDHPREIELSVYNSIGEKIRTLVSGKVSAGQHRATFTGYELPSGVYFVRLKSGEIISTKKITLLK